MSDFTKFAEKIANKEEFLNESSIDTYRMNSLISNCAYNLQQLSAPSMDCIWNWLNNPTGPSIAISPTKEVEPKTFEVTPEFEAMYEQLCVAFTKAKLSFVKTLSEELKKIK